MKSILYPIALLLAMSCAKESGTPKIVLTDSNSVWLPTAVYSSWNYGSDTSVGFDRTDSIYYNADLKIEKVISIDYTAYKPYILVNRFVYNTDGSIDSMVFTSNYDNNDALNYLFFYNSNGRLDSMIKKNPDNSYSPESYTFQYDDNNHIQHVRYFNPLANNTHGTADYYRNASGELDSIVEYISVISADPRRYVIRPKGETVLDATGINVAYLFRMALQTNNGGLVNGTLNPYWEQYINPDIPLYKSGTYVRTDDSGNVLAPVDYHFEKILNVDGTVRWLILSRDWNAGRIYERKDKFIYNRVLNTKAVYQ